MTTHGYFLVYNLEQTLFTREDWLKCLQEVSSALHKKEESLPEQKHALEGSKMVRHLVFPYAVEQEALI